MAISFGKQLREQRQQLGLSQQTLADQLHVTRQTVSRWENDSTYPNLDVLVELSERLNLSLDTLLKSDNTDVVDGISHDVRQTKRYRKIMIGFAIILVVLVAGLGLLSWGRQTQNNLIDRANPFLPTVRGYAVLPKQTPTKRERVSEVINGKTVKKWENVPQSVDAYVINDNFGNGEWLRFQVGEIPEKGMNYAYVQHKGSYVSRARLVHKNDIPKMIRNNMGTYLAYHKAAEGPRSSANPFR